MQLFGIGVRRCQHINYSTRLQWPWVWVRIWYALLSISLASCCDRQSNIAELTYDFSIIFSHHSPLRLLSRTHFAWFSILKWISLVAKQYWSNTVFNVYAFFISHWIVYAVHWMCHQIKNDHVCKIGRCIVMNVQIKYETIVITAK